MRCAVMDHMTRMAAICYSALCQGSPFVSWLATDVLHFTKSTGWKRPPDQCIASQVSSKAHAAMHVAEAQGALLLELARGGLAAKNDSSRQRLSLLTAISQLRTCQVPSPCCFTQLVVT